MRSATSFFDKTLFRSQLKHTWPLWLGYTALWLFLVPVALFSALSAYQGGYSAADASLPAAQRRRARRRLHFLRLRAFLCDARLLAPDAEPRDERLPRAPRAARDHLSDRLPHGAILPAFQHSRHVPARRGGLRPTAPQLLGVTGAAMGSAMLEAVFFYSFAVLCMMMTGQILAAPVFYFVGNILVPAMEYLLRNFAGNFLFGYSGHADVTLDFLSPPLYMYPRGRHRLDRDLRERLVLCDRLRARAPLFHDPRRLRARGTCHRPHRAAPLPHAQERDDRLDGRLPWATPIFKYGVAFCTAVALGQFLYYFLFGQYRSSGNDSLPGTILCMAAAGLVGYFVAEMLVKRASASSARAQRARSLFRSLLCCSASR